MQVSAGRNLFRLCRTLLMKGYYSINIVME
nr:MAG TPA: hypothetical protein [Caudoviricetes sp.]